MTDDADRGEEAGAELVDDRSGDGDAEPAGPSGGPGPDKWQDDPGSPGMSVDDLDSWEAVEPHEPA